LEEYQRIISTYSSWFTLFKPDSDEKGQVNCIRAELANQQATIQSIHGVVNRVISEIEEKERTKYRFGDMFNSPLKILLQEALNPPNSCKANIGMAKKY
jgi:hypothetical protein